jgi:hypothetical protein
VTLVAFRSRPREAGHISDRARCCCRLRAWRARLCVRLKGAVFDGRNEQAPRLRESPRLLRGPHTSLEAPTPRCNASPGSCGPPRLSAGRRQALALCPDWPPRSVQAWPALHHQHRHASVR